MRRRVPEITFIEVGSAGGLSLQEAMIERHVRAATAEKIPHIALAKLRFTDACYTTSARRPITMELPPMTPEERDRTIEFILNCQARYESRLEHEAEERKYEAEQRKLEAELREHDAEQRKHEAEEWKKDRQAIVGWIGEVKQFVARIVELVEIQSRRLDVHENWFREIEKEGQRRHEESMARLDRIIDRLSDSKQRPN